ncbi:MAG: PIN domain-containing protein [Sporichthyaceae bacterium]
MGLTLDAGALIGFDRMDRRAVAVIRRARERKEPLLIPVGVIGQVWRDGRRQARLASLLSADDVEIVELDDLGARAAGQMCGVAGTSDVVDATVVLCSRTRGRRIATSDADDLRALDPTVTLIRV